MEDMYIKNIFTKALTKLLKDNQEININNIELEFDIPKNAEHGDLSTNICMRLAKPMKLNPKLISEKLIALLDYDKKIIDKIETAGVGFINIKFSVFYYQEQLKNIFNKRIKYGKTNENEGKSVNVEYVSANPTGLLHLGHARNAAIGDTLANLYEWTGYKVVREYYFNNAGNQMNNFAKSIYARMLQTKDKNYPFPEDGYHGEYIKTIAEEIINVYKDAYYKGTNEDLEAIKKYGEKWCFDKIKRTLEQMKIKHDIFFNEDTLYKEGKINEVINELKTKDLIYEKDGATWFSLTKMGLETDRVIIKSTGEPTYRLPDIAYHKDKLSRNYDLVVDLFGADHIATVPDVLAGIKALGLDENKIKVIIHQFVTLTENGQQVKMSKRTGKSYTLDELVEELGGDTVRLFCITRNINTHLEFDLDVAKMENDSNPVFYLQYALTRIYAIFRKLNNIKENNEHILDSLKAEQINLELLNDKNEINLIKQIMQFPVAIKTAANKSEPCILYEYMYNLASTLHLFYHNCRVINENQKLMIARLSLLEVCKHVLENGFSILGIDALIEL